MSAAAGKIDVPCPQCKSKLAVPVAAMGKSGKCPRCGHVFPLAMPAQRPAAPAPAPSLLTPLTPAGGADLGLTPLGGGADLMPLSDAALAPLPAASHLAPLASGNPFADAMQGNRTLQPLAPAPYAPATAPPSASVASQYLANANAEYEENRHKKYAPGGSGCGFGAGILGGIFMMVIAVVWCGVVLLVTEGRRFPIYPPILFVVGLIAMVRGFITGNLTSE